MAFLVFLLLKKVIPGEESLLRLNNEKVQNWLQAKVKQNI